jgi:hypothetical protein
MVSYSRYDIFKKPPDGDPLWVETTARMEAAEKLIAGQLLREQLSTPFSIAVTGSLLNPSLKPAMRPWIPRTQRDCRGCVTGLVPSVCA